MSVLVTTFLVSLCYFVLFVLTFRLVFPAQVMLLGDIAHHVSFLFLPHGVRVLAAWLFRWRSVFYLLPGVILAQYWLRGSAAFEGRHLGLLALRASIGWLGFVFLEGLSIRPGRHFSATADWKIVLAAGALASLFNSLGSSLIFGYGGVSVFGYFVGDMSGQFCLMLALMFFFRALRVD